MRAPEGLPWALAGCTVWILLALWLLLGTPDSRTLLLERGPGSSWSSGPRGTSRLWTALRRIGVPAQRVREGEVPPPGTTLVVVDPAEDGPPVELFRTRSALSTLLVAGDAGQIRRVCWFLAPKSVPETSPANAARVVQPLAYPARDLEVPALRAFDRLPAGFTVLAAAGDGRPVAMTALASGQRTILCSEPRLFENAWVDRADNALFALGLIAGRESVTFDDRWVSPAAAGAGSIEMMALLYGTPGGRAAVTAILAVALALYLRGLRPAGPSGRPRAFPPSTAYAAALAEVHLLTGRGAEALAWFQGRLRRKAARRLGVPPDAGIEELARRLAAVTGRDAGTIAALLRTRVPPRHVAEQVRRLDHLSEAVGP